MGDKYSNVGFFHVEDLAHVTDDELYSMLINDEFKEFMKTRFPKYIEEV